MFPKFTNGYTTENWLAMFDPNPIDHTVQEAQYDTNDQLLRIKMDYNQNADFSAMTVSLSPDTLSSPYATIISIPSKSKNNLSLIYYEENVYFLAKIIKYITYSLTGAALLFFVVGNLGAKIAALECVALFQLTSLLQLSLNNMSPTFAAIRPLTFALGATPIYQSTTYY